ncbi:MAG: amidohydrolase [Tindallia sp. MSAO_Bac2]|nr:MAG: amidohydrolase [Tindallia sp. MSAO_Bac2]
MMTINEKELDQYVRKMYKKLHQTPEKSYEEFETAKIVAGELRSMGLEVEESIAKTGVVARQKTNKEGPVIALRADMDALCLFQNHRETVSHVCGHDAHMAMVLGAAKILASQKPGKGEILYLFQPSEEKLDGAKKVIESGALDNVDEMIGIHVRPENEMPAGYATPALMHGSVQIIRAEIIGKNAHGARPHLGINALEAAVLSVNALNALHFDPNVPHSVKVTKLLVEGDTYNLIPDTAEIHVDIRAQNNQLMRIMTEEISKAIDKSAGALGAKTIIDTVDHTLAAEYDEDVVKSVEESIVEVLGKSLPPVATSGSEDFHFYASYKKIKTAYIGLGAGVRPGLHHPAFRLEKGMLAKGSDILAKSVLKRIG